MILPGTGRGTGGAGGGGVPRMLRPEVATARRLRRNMSLPEVLLWERLRGQRTGLRFRRQHPIGPYIAHFYAATERVVIEIDGETHGRGEQLAHDRMRDEFLEENGCRVLRIAAAEVLRDVEAVVVSIVTFASRPLHHASHGPPPRSGGG